MQDPYPQLHLVALSWKSRHHQAKELYGLWLEINPAHNVRLIHCYLCAVPPHLAFE